MLNGIELQIEHYLDEFPGDEPIEKPWEAVKKAFIDPIYKTKSEGNKKGMERIY
ncbi:MAG: hypothetical protein J7L23_00630 [Candidatus Diapherotrites archaeon]|nr:hypothetical protein [Candidatus Diapherotrites archaeon]